MTTPAKTTALARPAATPHMLAGNKGFGITADKLDDTLVAYSERDAETLRWWFDTARDHGWTLSTLANRTGVSTTTLSRLFRGKYEGDVPGQLLKLATARETFSETAENPDYIHTALGRRMFAAFDKARTLRTVVILWGDMGIGKTVVQQEYQTRNNHGSTYYFRCPGFGVTLFQFTCALADAMRISWSHKSSDKVRDQIARFLSRGNRLLIVDELHEIFATCQPRHIARIFEWLRQLYDQCDCGLALVGTNVLRREFFDGRYADLLGQLVDRGTIQIPLPSKPTKSDIRAFLKHYGLELPAPDTEAHRLLMDILAAHGLRKLTLHLRDGVTYAVKKDEPYTWDHFIAAFQAIQTLTK